MRTGFAQLPLHYGSCPSWLFKRMKTLAGAITEIIIEEFGPNELLLRLSNPYFFQAFGCVLGFDWHSSGLTTTVCGALKEALNKKELGVFVAGGKGSVSRKTPEEIEKYSEKLNLSTTKIQTLINASKLTAKVDNALVQDGYSLYHHIFIFTEKGKWAVIQQGMNSTNRLARRYHWLSDSFKEFVEEPHTAICAQQKEKEVLDLTSKQAREAREISVDLVQDFDLIKKFTTKQISQTSLTSPDSDFKVLNMAAQHHIKDELKLNYETLKRAAEIQPKNYTELIMVPGFGPKHVRALALIANLIYGAELSWQDPAKYSFAHGGKDGIPYPVDKELYDASIVTLQEAIKQAKLSQKEKFLALKQLQNF
ncbi:MAG: DUF763 domain-containing protein [Candidatus Nanoarchaeia archaeon]